MRKRIGSFLWVGLLIVVTFSIHVSADEIYTDSGGKEFSKLSKAEIVQLLAENPETYEGEIFEEEPHTSAPYAPGRVTDEFLDAATGYLNALRRIAGVPPVEWDRALCDNAQYGAILLTVSEFSHTPSQPADMSDEFYQEALFATSSSNISGGREPVEFIHSLMSDTDGMTIDPNAMTNLRTVGHRRWQLNPFMGKVGFGYATSNQGYRRYATEKVFDQSGEGCTFNFISWPSSGYFPKDLFGRAVPWSVTVNTSEYGIPSYENVTVKLTRVSDGKKWEFSKEDTDVFGDFFTVNLDGYGIPNCIIFRPGEFDGTYEDWYQVEISGLDKPLCFEVHFFDREEADLPDPSRYFSDVMTNSWYFAAAEYVYEHNIMAGTGTGTFSPSVTLNRAQAVQILYNLEGQPDISDENLGYPYEDVNAEEWYGNAVYWARITGVATGYGDGTFQPGDSITRQEFAQMLYNYAKYKGYDLTAAGDLSQFSDSGSVADWAEAAMSWANGNELINGHDDGALEPGGTATRAQAASILMKFNQNLVEN